ncbi:MAG: hypothetical protein ACRD3E_17375 [Terriglobales bacterium]
MYLYTHPSRFVRRSALLAVACALMLAGCGQSGSGSPTDTTAASSSPADSGAPSAQDSQDADTPKVPFGNHPCQTLSQDEQKSLGFNLPLKATASRTPDGLPVDNTCTYESVGAVAIEYGTRQDYEYQRDNLRKAGQAAPADVPSSFYDVLGNLWFAKDGYYVTVTNVGQPVSIEKVTAVVAAKL